MFRLWGKTFLHNRMTNDIVVCNDSEESRTSKIFQAVTEICQTGRVKVRVECRLPMCGTDGKDENNDLLH